MIIHAHIPGSTGNSAAVKTCYTTSHQACPPCDRRAVCSSTWSMELHGNRISCRGFYISTQHSWSEHESQQWTMRDDGIACDLKTLIRFGTRFPQVFSPLSKHAIQPDAKCVRPSHMVTRAPWQQNLMKTFYISRQFLSKWKSSLEQWDSSWLCVICWNLNITLYKVTVTDVPI